MREVSKAIESGGNYIKFPDGKLIIFDRICLLANVENCRYYFPISFINVSYITHATYTYSTEPYANVSIGSCNKDWVDIFGKGLTLGNQYELNVNIFVIGRWK